MNTLWPFSISFFAPSGVTPTLFSLFFISLIQPMFIRIPPCQVSGFCEHDGGMTISINFMVYITELCFFWVFGVCRSIDARFRKV